MCFRRSVRRGPAAPHAQSEQASQRLGARDHRHRREADRLVGPDRRRQPNRQRTRRDEHPPLHPFFGTLELLARGRSRPCRRGRVPGQAYGGRIFWRSPRSPTSASATAPRRPRCCADAHRSARADDDPYLCAHDDSGLLAAIDRGEHSFVPVTIEAPAMTVDMSCGYSPDLDTVVELMIHHMRLPRPATTTPVGHRSRGRTAGDEQWRRRRSRFGRRGGIPVRASRCRWLIR